MSDIEPTATPSDYLGLDRLRASITNLRFVLGSSHLGPGMKFVVVSDGVSKAPWGVVQIMVRTGDLDKLGPRLARLNGLDSQRATEIASQLFPHVQHPSGASARYGTTTIDSEMVLEILEQPSRFLPSPSGGRFNRDAVRDVFDIYARIQSSSPASPSQPPTLLDKLQLRRAENALHVSGANNGLGARYRHEQAEEVEIRRLGSVVADQSAAETDRKAALRSLSEMPNSSVPPEVRAQIAEGITVEVDSEATELPEDISTDRPPSPTSLPTNEAALPELGVPSLRANPREASSESSSSRLGESTPTGPTRDLEQVDISRLGDQGVKQLGALAPTGANDTDLTASFEPSQRPVPSQPTTYFPAIFSESRNTDMVSSNAPAALPGTQWLQLAENLKVVATDAVKWDVHHGRGAEQDRFRLASMKAIGQAPPDQLAARGEEAQFPAMAVQHTVIALHRITTALVESVDFHRDTLRVPPAKPSAWNRIWKRHSAETEELNERNFLDNLDRLAAVRVLQLVKSSLTKQVNSYPKATVAEHVLNPEQQAAIDQVAPIRPSGLPNNGLFMNVLASIQDAKSRTFADVDRADTRELPLVDPEVEHRVSQIARNAAGYYVPLRVQGTADGPSSNLDTPNSRTTASRSDATERVSAPSLDDIETALRGVIAKAVWMSQRDQAAVIGQTAAKHFDDIIADPRSYRQQVAIGIALQQVAAKPELRPTLGRSTLSCPSPHVARDIRDTFAADLDLRPHLVEKATTPMANRLATGRWSPMGVLPPEHLRDTVGVLTGRAVPTLNAPAAKPDTFVDPVAATPPTFHLAPPTPARTELGYGQLGVEQNADSRAVPPPSDTKRTLPGPDNIGRSGPTDLGR